MASEVGLAASAHARARSLAWLADSFPRAHGRSLRHLRSRSGEYGIHVGTRERSNQASVRDHIARVLGEEPAVVGFAGAAHEAGGSKALVRVSLFSRGGVVDGAQVGDGEDRIVRYCGKTIGTRYIVGDKFHEHVNVHATSHDPACVHPSEADVLELLRSGELGSHYLLLDPTPPTRRDVHCENRS